MRTVQEQRRRDEWECLITIVVCTAVLAVLFYFGFVREVSWR